MAYLYLTASGGSCTHLNRLVRSTCDLLDIAEWLRDAEAGLRSVAELWVDPTSPPGRMMLTVFASIAAFA